MEQWNMIPGYEGIYEASTSGHIRSVNGKTTSNARYDRRVWKSRVLSEKSAKRRGDKRVTLWKNGEEKTWLVARLVALAWHGDPGAGMTVNHINGDPTDNRAVNLEWVTLSDNIRKGFDVGLYKAVCRDVTLEGIDGTKYPFSSMASADRWLGRAAGYVSNSYRQGRRCTSSKSGETFSVLLGL